MANEVSHRHTATGETLYFTIRNTARQMWNTAGTPNFETLVVANWGDYDVALSESPASSYFYQGTFPAISGNMVAGWYWVDVYKRAGGSPAISDTLYASYFGYWDGTTFKFWGMDMLALSGSTTAADNMEASAETIITGTVGVGSTTTSIVTSAVSPVGVDADQFKGRILIFLRGTTTTGLRAEGTDIIAATAAANPTFTVSALTQAPVSGDTFVIV